MNGAGRRLISCDFSSDQNIRRKVDVSLWNLKRQGHAGLANQPDLPFARLQAALRLRPRRALSSAEAPASLPAGPGSKRGLAHALFRFLIAQGCLVLIAPRQDYQLGRSGADS